MGLIKNLVSAANRNLLHIVFHCQIIDEGDSAGGSAATEDAQARSNYLAVYKPHDKKNSSPMKKLFIGRKRFVCL